MKKYQWTSYIIFPSRVIEKQKDRFGDIFLFLWLSEHTQGEGGCVWGSFTINLYISPLRIWLYNLQLISMGYMGCLVMYVEDIEWREFPHCFSQIPERALAKYPVDPIIVPAQIWFEMNVEFVWSNSKMFVLLVWNILICRQLTRQYATKGRPRIRQTLANMQTFDQN